MKYDFLQSTCRVCLAKNKKLKSIYTPIDEGEEAPYLMLKKITGICLEAVNELSYLPKHICKNCELSLNMAFEFRSKALKTQLILENHIRNVTEKSCKSINANKHEIKEETVDNLIEIQQLDVDVDILEDNADDSTLHVMDETINHVITTNENDKYNLNHQEPMDKEIDQPITQNSSKDNEESSSDETTYIIKGEVEQIIVEEHLEGDKSCEHVNENADCSDATCNDIETACNVRNRKKSRKNSRTLKANRERIKSGETTSLKQSQVSHICDICGNVYAKRGRMMEHRQRHDKELKYCCELCDKKFHMRELLRKHMFAHRGGKPLKCDYCSRTFYYESVRKAHEAVHRGLRPYVCDICSKSFSYAHALKKHQLIHLQIKLYRCSYCDKDFRLQHHMKQHESSKLHKNAVRSAMESQSLTAESIESCEQFAISTPNDFAAI